MKLADALARSLEKRCRARNFPDGMPADRILVHPDAPVTRTSSGPIIVPEGSIPPEEIGANGDAEG